MSSLGRGERRDVAAESESLEQLTRAARRGEREAFERLVRETAPGVYALAFRLLGNEHDARDAAQETYLRAYRSIGRFRSEAAVTTWLYRIAANCCTTQLSRRRVALPLEAAGELADEAHDGDPEAVAATAAERDQLASALSRLPDPLRAVVVLHDVYELGHEAIAAELKISRAASKVRLHRARRRLREQLFPKQRPGDASAPDAAAAVVRPLVRRPQEADEVHQGAVAR